MKQDQHILITGGATRVGRFLTEKLLSQHAKVTLLYFHSEKEAKQIQKQYPQDVDIVRLDLTNIEDIEKWSITKSRFGKIDLFIHNASIFVKTPLNNFQKITFENILHSNFTSAYILSQKIALFMNPQASIIFICDIYADRPLAKYSLYTASKAALKNLTKSLALELAPNIRVNSISPGTILPPVFFTTDDIAKDAENTLLKRVGSPQDIYEGVYFLTKNSYITGFNLVVDGGKSLMPLKPFI